MGLMENRYVRNNPMETNRSLSILLNRLKNLSGGDHAVMIALLDKAVLKNWDSVYRLEPDEMPDKQSGRVEGEIDGI